jgi:hypothetical protein
LKKVAIVQSNYIPWKGYFDLINYADEFILFDDMQYTRRDWRNRNKIKTPQGLQWLTIPVRTRGGFNQKIKEIKIAGTDWATKHWKSLEKNYRRSPCFEEIEAWLEPMYDKADNIKLSEINRHFIETICTYLSINTKITNSWDYNQKDGKSERLASLCKEAGGDIYVSGPTARNYLDEAIFIDNEIKVEWFDYSNYPPYPQLWGKFEHSVSILDLLFNCGKNSLKYCQLNS